MIHMPHVRVDVLTLHSPRTATVDNESIFFAVVIILSCNSFGPSERRRYGRSSAIIEKFQTTRLDAAEYLHTALSDWRRYIPLQPKSALVFYRHDYTCVTILIIFEKGLKRIVLNLFRRVLTIDCWSLHLIRKNVIAKMSSQDHTHQQLDLLQERRILQPHDDRCK